jgi:hypothetical protein
MQAGSLTGGIDQFAWSKGAMHGEGAIGNKTIQIVCEPCNTGWMSRLQDQVKPTLVPILEGKWPDNLSSWDRRVLAAWAAMFTMVIEFTDPRTQATSFSQRENLRLTLEAPKGWYVWIGLHEGPLWKVGYNHFGWGQPRELTDALPPIEMQSTGWVVGPAFFQTLSSTIYGFKANEFAFAKKHGLSVVWPSDGRAIVRPINVLDDISADGASSDLLPPDLSRTNIRRAWEHCTQK